MLDDVLSKLGDRAVPRVSSRRARLRGDGLDRVRADAADGQSRRAESRRSAPSVNASACASARSWRPAKTRRNCASSPSTMLKNLVDALNLTSWLSTEKAKETLAKAGFRGAGAEYAFVTFRLVAPIAFAAVRERLHLRHREIDPAAADEARLRHVRDVPGHQGAGNLSAQFDHQATEVVGARLSEHARPPA